MIEFCNGDFSAKRDKYGWTLVEYFDSHDKDGNPKRGHRESYYANIDQVCEAVIDREAGHCDGLVELREILADAKTLLVEEIETRAKV